MHGWVVWAFKKVLWDKMLLVQSTGRQCTSSRRNSRFVAFPATARSRYTFNCIFRRHLCSIIIISPTPFPPSRSLPPLPYPPLLGGGRLSPQLPLSRPNRTGLRRTIQKRTRPTFERHSFQFLCLHDCPSRFFARTSRSVDLKARFRRHSWCFM